MLIDTVFYRQPPSIVVTLPPRKSQTRATLLTPGGHRVQFHLLYSRAQCSTDLCDTLETLTLREIDKVFDSFIKLFVVYPVNSDTFPNIFSGISPLHS